MLETIGIFLALVPIIIGLFNAYGTDDFKALTFTPTESFYKNVLTVTKKISICLFYSFLLGLYYHQFPLLFNDYAIYYFVVLIIIAFFMYLVLIIKWFYNESNVPINENYKKGFLFAEFIGKIAFYYLYIYIWISIAKEYKLENYEKFYNTGNLLNILIFSLILSVFYFIISKIFARFFLNSFEEKFFYFEEAKEDCIKFIKENEFYLLENLDDKSYYYLDFKKQQGKKIYSDKRLLKNKKNFIYMILVLVTFFFFILLIFKKIFVKILIKITKCMINLDEDLLKKDYSKNNPRQYTKKFIHNMSLKTYKLLEKSSNRLEMQSSKYTLKLEIISNTYENSVSV